MMQFGLQDYDIARINSIFSLCFDVEKVIIYGSRAMGTNNPSSDIDLTLIGGNLNLTTQQKIERELDDLLLPVTFDVSIYHKISNPDLIEHIKRVGKILYEK